MSMKCRKRNFKTKQEAVSGIEQVKILNISKGKREKKNNNLHSYLCPECNTWHIGHKINKFMKVY